MCVRTHAAEMNKVGLLDKAFIMIGHRRRGTATGMHGPAAY